jgi:hypothetical protein
MLRFFLFVVGVMAVGTSAAGEVSPCADTVPIQVMENTSPNGGTRIILSADEISDSLPHFRAFVTAVTEHINSRLTRGKLCITNDKNMTSVGLQFRDNVDCMNNAKGLECMINAERRKRSLLQFVEWGLTVRHEYLVPAMISIGGRGLPSCRISSPWMDLVFYQEPSREQASHMTPVSEIRGIVRWNERQMLADQAVLAGAKNVPPGVAMPITGPEFGYFADLYKDTIYPRLYAAQVVQFATEFGLEIPPHLAEEMEKPIKEHDNIPPDLLWLFLRSSKGLLSFSTNLRRYDVTKKSAEGYTKLVLALIDRCFASDEKTELHYTNILDAADLIPLEQYKIDTSFDWIEQYKKGQHID